MAEFDCAALYREVVVWRRLTEVEAIRYTCFEELDSGRFCVQVADWVRLPIENDSLRFQARNRLELLLEGQLEACHWRPSLQEAIAAHETDFA